MNMLMLIVGYAWDMHETRKLKYQGLIDTYVYKNAYVRICKKYT